MFKKSKASKPSPASSGGGSGEGVVLPPWSPIAAGVVAGVGLLILVYKAFSNGNCVKEPKTKFICTYDPGVMMIKAGENSAEKKKPVKKKKKDDSCMPCGGGADAAESDKTKKKEKVTQEWCFLQTED